MVVAPTSGRVELSVVIPMRNESENARRCIDKVEGRLKSFAYSYEIIVAEDGSTDSTREIVNRIASANPNVRCSCSVMKLGKGAALKNAIGISRGDLIVTLDADIDSGLDTLPSLIRTARETDGIALGSRVLSGVADSRPIVRRVATKLYNGLVRFLFGDDIRDHQCGLKVISRHVANILIQYVQEKGFAWDTEVISLARRLGYKVTEVPVKFTEKRSGLKTHVNILKDGLYMGMSLIAIKYRLGKAYAENFKIKTTAFQHSYVLQHDTSVVFNRAPMQFWRFMQVS
ncbi:MAG: glycosyltransferase [Candidatus Atabeyarchaeum deiterrae]|jgi:glycosyltransferase involved in cell wall biosynthesis